MVAVTDLCVFIARVEEREACEGRHDQPDQRPTLGGAVHVEEKGHEEHQDTGVGDGPEQPVAGHDAQAYHGQHRQGVPEDQGRQALDVLKCARADVLRNENGQRPRHGRVVLDEHAPGHETGDGVRDQDGCAVGQRELEVLLGEHSVRVEDQLRLIQQDMQRVVLRAHRKVVRGQVAGPVHHLARPVRHREGEESVSGDRRRRVDAPLIAQIRELLAQILLRLLDFFDGLADRHPVFWQDIAVTADRATHPEALGGDFHQVLQRLRQDFRERLLLLVELELCERRLEDEHLVVARLRGVVEALVQLTDPAVAAQVERLPIRISQIGTDLRDRALQRVDLGVDLEDPGRLFTTGVINDGLFKKVLQFIHDLVAVQAQQVDVREGERKDRRQHADQAADHRGEHDTRGFAIPSQAPLDGIDAVVDAER
mmetsp:Transcript_39910/g.120519  ORF Transcript_39910/g.120519 Transcript_39910/m.120519 type:complete len:426 (+) Transcript_39910:1013-2290(+)